MQTQSSLFSPSSDSLQVVFSMFFILQFSGLFLITNSKSQHKVDDDSCEQGDSQDGRTQPVIEAALTAHADASGTPMECEQGINHSHHGDESKKTSADLADIVAKVKETDSQSTENDGEVEP